MLDVGVLRSLGDSPCCTTKASGEFQVVSKRSKPATERSRAVDDGTPDDCLDQYDSANYFQMLFRQFPTRSPGSGGLDSTRMRQHRRYSYYHEL